ncbi:MAG: amidohydrolase [Candidatus Latescibacteria bacterium]|nr:amidohydrolase [Candidatus Latescibacterota bacterium]
MIIDAHTHLWDIITGDIGQPVRSIGNGLITIGQQKLLGMPAFLLDGRAPVETFISLMNSTGVDAAVVTQEYLDGNQNEYLAEVSKKYPERFFIHGLLEFRNPDALSEEFHHMRETFGFNGIKVPAKYLAETDPRIYLTDSRLTAVFEKMKRNGMILSIDLASGDTQVEEMREISHAFHGLTIVIGHFAMTNRLGWMKQLSLAEEPNIYIESGGITWLFRNEGPPFPGAQEAFRTAVDLVGADKLMWGSDFPRTLVDFTYEQTLDFLRNGCDFLDAGQKSTILGGTARKVYGFSEPVNPQQRITKITELD